MSQRCQNATPFALRKMMWVLFGQKGISIARNFACRRSQCEASLYPAEKSARIRGAYPTNCGCADDRVARTSGQLGARVARFGSNSTARFGIMEKLAAQRSRRNPREEIDENSMGNSIGIAGRHCHRSIRRSHG